MQEKCREMGQLFIPQVTAGRELELLLFTKQQRNMVDMPTFLPETVYSGRMCLFHWKIWIYGFLTKLTDRLRNFAGSNGQYVDADGNVKNLKQSIDELVASKKKDAESFPDMDGPYEPATSA